jgi:hypothetical protein
MTIETKYEIGDLVRYDEVKKGKIVGYEISNKRGIYYTIKAMKDKNRPAGYYLDLMFLKNNGCLRHENDLQSEIYRK